MNGKLGGHQNTIYENMCQTDNSKTNHDFRKLLNFGTNFFCVNDL